MIDDFYVEIKREWVASGGPKIYCPYDPKTNKLYYGLTTIGFVPKWAKIVGEFDELTGELRLNESHESK